MAISPMFCTPRGTSFGLANAAQKKTITAAAQSSAISIGFVKWNEPMLNSGLKSKLFRPGEGNPHPLKRWHPPPGAIGSATTRTSPITCHLLPGRPRYRSLLAVAVDDEADRDRQADQHADGEQQRHVDGPPDQPADPAVGEHPGDQVAEHRPAHVQAAGPAFRRGPALGDPRAGAVAFSAHLIRPAVPQAAPARRTAS